jgi:hypothetical protein
LLAFALTPRLLSRRLSPTLTPHPLLSYDLV